VKDQKLKEARRNSLLKKKRGNPSNQTFMLNAVRILCKTKRHPLYLCDRFKQLPVSKHIEVIKNAKLCYNCLRLHRDRPCKFSNYRFARGVITLYILRTQTNLAQWNPRSLKQNYLNRSNVNDKLCDNIAYTCPATTVLTSVLVCIYDRKHNRIVYRALLDTCAIESYIGIRREMSKFVRD